MQRRSFVTEERTGSRRTVFRALVVLGLLASALGPGCRRRAPFAGAPVFIVSIDTLRADHLGIYGGRGPETPAIDRLAREGVVFDTAIAHVPLTLPSHAALFTGLLPFQNGVRDNLGYRLDPARATLAGLLRTGGYATGGAVSAIVLDHATGISSGFDAWDDAIESPASGSALAEVRRSGRETLRRLDDWIDRAGDGRPLFGFLHLYEPHAPYVPPEPFATRYAGRLYDGAIAEADSIVGSFLAHLESRGLYDRALIVLLSDHGEGLGNHGEQEHGVLLYREAIHVPLILKLPGGRDGGRRVGSAAGLVDVLPTILSAVGLAAPGNLAGVPLWPSPPAAGSRKIYSETMFPRFHFGWSDLASLTDGTSHYVHGPRPELYDWPSDPAERHDLAAGRTPAFRAMRSALDAISRPLEAPGAADPETVRKLASLGYVGASAGEKSGDSSRALPDPKDRIALVARLAEAGRLSSRGQPAEAAAHLLRIVRENPGMTEARQMLADSLLASGRADDAWRELVAVDRARPGIPQVMLELASVAMARGAPAEARAYALSAQAAGSSEAEPVLAEIALAEGDGGKAKELAESLARKRPSSRAARLFLARVENDTGNPAAALEALDALARLDAASPGAPGLADASFLRGDALARLSRPEEARAAFAAEIRDFPENPRPYAGLALLEASGGNGAEAERLLSTLLSRARAADSWFLAARVYDVLGDRAAALRTRSEAARRFPGARERGGPPAGPASR